MHQAARLGSLILLVPLAFLFTGWVHARSVDIVQVEVMGYGSNQTEATFEALTEAIRQVHGVSVQSSRSLAQSSSELSVTHSDGSQDTIRFAVEASGEIVADTAGYVSGYRVLSSSPHPRGHAVRLQVDLPVYVGTSRQHESRRRMAVYPLTADPNLHLFNRPLHAEQASSRLTQAMVNAFTQTRRFAMLERQHNEAMLRERRLLSDPSVPVEEKARLARTLGADYIVIGHIAGLDVSAHETISSLTGERREYLTGAVVVDIRILSPATRQVMWSESLTLPARQLFARLEVTDSMAGVEQALWQNVADYLSTRAVGAIYPLRAIDLTADGTIVINQGGSQLFPGQQLEVFALGNEVFDPYSGESLGRHESRLGMVEVYRVTDRLSYAYAVDLPDIELDPAAYVLRPVAAAAIADSQNDPRHGTRQGIRLPADRQ
jgi:hypothetical protein